MAVGDEIPDWARNIARRRREVGLSQTKLADRLHVSQSAVADWERGKSRPRAAYWRDLARELNTTVDSIFPDLEIRDAPHKEWMPAGESKEVQYDKASLIPDRAFLFGQLFSSWIEQAEKIGLYYNFSSIAASVYSMWESIEENPSSDAIDRVVREAVEHYRLKEAERLEQMDRLILRYYRVKP
mgnify:CR=1 FL=1